MKKLLLSLLCLLTVSIAGFAADVTINLNGDLGWTPDLPTDYNAETATDHTLNGVTITVYDVKTQNVGLILAKTNGYVKLPTFNKKVESITFYSQAGASKKAVVSLYENDATTAVTGTNSVTTTDPAVDKGYTITIPAASQKTGVRYRLQPSSVANAQITKIEVTYAADANTVATPSITPSSKEFSETFQATITCATDGADIYYTLNGTTPSASSTKYNGAISIAAGADVTLKAIAIKSGLTNSSVAEAKYTYVDPAKYACATAAEWLAKAKADTNHAYTITGTLTVSYNANTSANGNGNQYTYVQDNTGSILVYGTKNNLTPGQTVTGLSGSFTDFRNLAEMTGSNIADLTPGAGVAPQPASMKVADIKAEDMNKYVKISGVAYNADNKTAAEGGSSIAIYSRFAGVDLPTADGNYDIEGFVCIYGETLQIYPTKFTAAATEANISWSKSEVNFTWEPNYAAKLPTLNNPDNVAVTYASSDESKATIDATGNVTLVAPGECNISATAGSKTVSYKLTVGQVNMIAQGLIEWTGTTDGGFTATMGANNTFPTIKVTEGYNLTGTVYGAFEQAPEEGFTGDVATVNAEGVVTLVNPGKCRIGYSWGVDNPFITAANCNYLLTVKPAAAGGGVQWSAPSAQVTYNSAGVYELPTLSNPDNVAVTYSSSDTAIATIDATGKVTVVKPGSTTITAAYGDNKKAEYALVIDKIHFTVSFAPLTDGKFTAKMGTTPTYPTMTVEPAAEMSHWFGVVYDSTNKSVATVNNAGEITLVAPGETEIRVINGGDDYVMGDNYLGYKLVVEAAGPVTLQAPEFFIMNDSTDEVPNGGTTSGKVVATVENKNGAGTTMDIVLMQGADAESLTTIAEETSYAGSYWEKGNLSTPGLYVFSVTIKDAQGNDAYGEYTWTISGSSVRTYIKPLVSFTSADAQNLYENEGEAPVLMTIENQNPSGLQTKIYYKVGKDLSTIANYTESAETSVEVKLTDLGEYSYETFVATYDNNNQLTGTSETVSGKFTVVAATLKDATFAATDKDGAAVEAGAKVAEDKAPVKIVVTNPNANTQWTLDLMNITTGETEHQEPAEATYTFTVSNPGEYGLGAYIWNTDGLESYKEFNFTIEGEPVYNMTAPIVEFLNDDYDEVPSPCTQLPVNMVISHQNYYEGCELVYTINGEETVTTENSVEISLTEPGTINYSVYVRKGQKSKSEVVEGTYEITAEAVKLVKPTITFTEPEEGDIPVTCTITNTNYKGAGTIMYMIGAGQWYEGDGATVTFLLQEYGTYTIYAYVRNNNDESLSSDTTIADYQLTSGINGVYFGNEGLYVAGGKIVAPEGAEIYTVSGIRVNASERMASGIYIVRLADGSAQKVLVK